MKYNLFISFNTEILEDKIGTMLPCNVIVQQKTTGIIEVSAIDPSASMQSIENKKLQEIAQEVKIKLEKAILQLK